MQSESAVRQKLKQVRFRYLKAEISEALQPTTNNCKHHLDVDGLGIGESLCGAGRDQEGWTPSLCRNSRAKECPLFCPVRDKDQIKLDMKEMLKQPLPKVAYNYPDMAALLWVLQDTNISDTDTEEEEIPHQEPPPPPSVSTPPIPPEPPPTLPVEVDALLPVPEELPVIAQPPPAPMVWWRRAALWLVGRLLGS